MTFKKLDSEKTKRILKICFLFLVCAVGLCYCLLYAETDRKFIDLYTPDESHYINMAKRLIDTGVYSFWSNGPDAVVSPGYPLFLTICMRIFGTSLQSLHYIKILQAFLFSLTVLMVFILGYLLTKKYSVSIIAAALVATNGMYAYFSRYFLTEILFSFFMMTALVLIVFSFQKEKWWLFLISGAVLCMSIMVRSPIAIMIPFIVLLIVLRNKKHYKKMLLFSGCFLLGFILVGMPWWIRNIVTLHKLTLFASQTNPIYAGLAENIDSLGITDPGTVFGNLKLFAKLFVSNPSYMIAWMTVDKFCLIFLHRESLPYLKDISNIIKDITVYFGLTGFIVAMFNKKLRAPILVFLPFLLIIFFAVPVSRYSLSFLPVFAIGAGYSFDKLFNKTSLLCTQKSI